ncbi:MAG: ATP-binding cassette domain-containing protein [Lachnospiraceae bacterium]|nr:ATP-binding cassette domain-containing protein [Lachnospiraceae bacterium]
MNQSIIFQSNQLTKIYGNTTALDHVNITIPKGSIYGLVGNNGAGKTTLFKLLAGHIFPTSGNFTLLGAGNESNFTALRKRCGCIIEKPGFFPNMTAKQNLEYYRIQRGIPGKDTVTNCLKLVGLSEASNKRFKAMSLGMKQRLGLALALIGEPELLILDEPINGLDPVGIIEIRNLLLKLNHEKHITILISSHILAELEHIATHYGILSQGKLLEETTAEQLREKCQSYLEVKVMDAHKYAALLESRLHCTNYKILPDNIVHIYGEIKDISSYSHLAVKSGNGLLSFAQKEAAFESYYMELITSKNQAMIPKKGDV